MLRTLATSATLAVVIGSSAYAQDLDIVQTAQATPDLSTLVTAVEAAGLAETLSGEGPFTVFAPSNAAFEALPEGTLDTLLADPATLGTILQCHVVAGEVYSEALIDMIQAQNNRAMIETLGGCMLEAELTEASGTAEVMITDENGNTIGLGAVDIATSNGVVHVIDGVIMPAM
ncbi:fasciclin domain-containing protein [Wenxinia saemankumensis]|uniref:Uncaracterized surface protein containing fasciclin (FAS1) repeats n=1 Tax=Wenxinia saemankumensis TaxID=1447782 RepID=A0A1M6BX36_9RHOB|nr:fasciclin domain-containing protein [Wenxinia saemankumensis]SHI53068.1 Uncaracterized surface protein containing fasciclin (FAS1) repeats [Wenxinia saemankumensis]